jgi:hypothetical protein
MTPNNETIIGITRVGAFDGTLLENKIGIQVSVGKKDTLNIELPKREFLYFPIENKTYLNYEIGKDGKSGEPFINDNPYY